MWKEFKSNPERGGEVRGREGRREKRTGGEGRRVKKEEEEGKER